MRKLISAALGVGLTVAMAGCGGAPEATRPNGTFEQVRHNLGGDDLGKLALNQTVSLSVRDAESVKLYNLTKQPVDEAAFKRMVGYFASLDSRPGPYTMNIYPKGKNNPVSVNPAALDREAAEHAFVLIPEDTPMPPAAGSGNKAITLHLEQQSQEISVVPQEQGKPFEVTNGLAVESCQSMVLVLGGSAAASSDPVEKATYNRLTQETFCNSMAKAATEAASGAPYEEYVEAVAADKGGKIGFNGGTYIDYATVTPPQYADMQQALIGQ
jgi:hypothetical protein